MSISAGREGVEGGGPEGLGLGTEMDDGLGVVPLEKLVGVEIVGGGEGPATL